MSSSQWTTSFLSDLTPPSLERAWQTAPHPTLPLVATCSADKTVRIYSLVNYKLLSVVTGGHKRSVRSSAWKPTFIEGESVLATGSFDATVGIWRRWDSYGREEEGGGGIGGENEGSGRKTTRPRKNVDEDEEADDDNDEDEEWRFAVLLDGHDSEVKSVSWSASGSLLATCSRDKSIWIWEDLEDGDNNFETVAVLQEHSGDVKCVSWHPAEECLASSSYDDTIRIWREDIDDWGQVACLKGHTGTVWFVDWEGTDYTPAITAPSATSNETSTKLREQWKEHHSLSGPRVVSCSADKTVRIWRRQAKEQPSQNAFSANNTGIPSIIRPTGVDETWFEESTLPSAHDLAIYAVAWSKRGGLIASTGADGRIVVYAEELLESAVEPAAEESRQEDGMDTVMSDAQLPASSLRTEWKVVAVIEAAHGIYEINHIAWAKRGDKRKTVNTNGTAGHAEETEEEILISTADDGSVKVWSIRRAGLE